MLCLLKYLYLLKTFRSVFRKKLPYHFTYIILVNLFNRYIFYQSLEVR
jgi:hypothetical protein